MTKKTNLIATYTLLALLAVLGAWLIGLFKSAPKDEISGLDMLLSFLGLLLFIGAAIRGCVLYSRNRKAMTNEESRSWEIVRITGKRSYIKNFVFGQLLITALSCSAVVLRDYANNEPLVDSLKINGILFIVVNGLGIYAAYRFWNYYESEFALKNSNQETEKSDSFAKQSDLN